MEGEAGSVWELSVLPLSFADRRRKAARKSKLSLCSTWSLSTVVQDCKPVLGTGRQEDHEFSTSLDDTVRLYLKTKPKIAK